MADPSKIMAGPWSIRVGTSDVGTTEGPIVLRAGHRYRDHRFNKYGETLVDRIHVGDALSVTFTCAETTLAVLRLLFVEGLQDTAYQGLGRAPGGKATAHAVSLTLHPLELAAGDTEYDIVLHRAAPRGEPIEVQASHDGDRLYRVTYDALIDTAKVDGDRLGRLGAAS